MYSIGYLAGWVVALFVIAEPLKRMGRFTFADALDNRFNSRSIKLAAAISTLVISIFYLIPQMVGAGGGDVIALDARGQLAMAFDTPGMYRGSVTEDGRVEVSVYDK